MLENRLCMNEDNDTAIHTPVKRETSGSRLALSKNSRIGNFTCSPRETTRVDDVGSRNLFRGQFDRRLAE